MHSRNMLFVCAVDRCVRTALWLRVDRESMMHTFSRFVANIISKHASAYRMAEKCSLGSAMQRLGQAS